MLENCFGCNNPVELRPLPFTEDEWFIKCNVCPAISTLAYLRQEDAIKEWNDRWGYAKIKALEYDITEMKKIGIDAFNKLTEDEKELKHRFEQLFKVYIDLRISTSGTWGNLSKEAQRTQLINEVKTDMGWNK